MIGAWIEKTDHRSIGPINAGNVRTLKTVAIKTAESQIFWRSHPRMLQRDDMVNLKRQLSVGGGKSTVFAEGIRALPYQFL